MMTPTNHIHPPHPHAGEALLGADDQRGQDLGAHDVADSHEGDETGARTRGGDLRWLMSPQKMYSMAINQSDVGMN